MARDFNGTTDRIDYANLANLTGSPITISAWLYLDVVNASQYIFCNHVSGNTSIGVIFWANTSTLSLQRAGSTFLTQRTNTFTISASVWFHALVTHDGVMTTAASSHIHKDGTELGYQTTTNGAAEVANTGSWSIGGRIYDDARNANGRVADLAVWNRVLDAAQITALSKGYAPSFFRSGLLLYTDLIRETNNRVGAAASTVDGTAVIEHPRMIYPSPKFYSFPPATSGWANIAKINGIASASIAKVDSIAVASISKINGIAV